MWCLEEVLMFENRYASLPVRRIHLFQLLHSESHDGGLNGARYILVRVQVRTERLQTNHFQSCRCFQRAVDMVVLSFSLGLIQVGRHPTV
jgi:hypothetical protein